MKFSRVFLLIGVAASASATTQLVTRVLQNPSIKILSLAEGDHIAVRGGHLELLANIETRRKCPGLVDRNFWRMAIVEGKSTRVDIPLPFRSEPIMPIGTARLLLLLDVPGNMDHGLWYYIGHGEYYCTAWERIFGPEVVETQNIPVTIGDPEADSTPVVVNAPTPITIVPEASK